MEHVLPDSNRDIFSRETAAPKRPWVDNMEMIRTRANPGARPVLCLLTVIACVLAIWLPFGFAMTGLIEEWGLLGLMELHGSNTVAGLGYSSPEVALRPLNYMPVVLANILSPDSFVAWHLLVMVALVVKGCASSYLVWRATRSLGFSVLMGVLVLVYPAETMQLSFRAIHINWSLALALLAGSVFIIAWDADNRRKAQFWGLLAGVLLLISILIYEAAFTLVVLPFLVLYAADGWKTPLARLKDRAGVVIAWLSGAAIYVLYALWMTHKLSTYQARLLGGKNLFVAVGEALPKLFSVGAARALFGGWIDAARMTASEFDSYVYLATAAMVIVVLIGGASRVGRSIDAADSHAESIRKALRLAVAGSVLMLAGYTPFLSSAAHIAISQRTFLFASPGAAMLWISALFGISLIAKPFARVICAGLVFFGLAAQLVQFNHYVRLAEVQRTLLRSIVENFDGNSAGKTLLILDESNYLGDSWMLDPENLRLALTYLYHRPIGPVQICHMPSMEWQEIDTLARKGVCLDAGSDWVFRYPKAPNGPAQSAIAVPSDMVLSKADVHVLRLNVDGTIDRDRKLDEFRKGLLTGDGPVDVRFRNILLEPRWGWYKRMFRDERAQSSYTWSFGDWWSLELPIRGSGWRKAEWLGNGFSHQAASWKFSEKSTLIFEFAPVATDYVLRGSFEMFANDQVRDKTTILLNGAETPLQWVSSTVFEARVPKNVLRRGINRIDFSAPIDDNYFGLSEKLHSFELVPASGI